MPSTLYWETKGHYEDLYNECFIVSQESQDKKRNNLYIWKSFLDTKMLKVITLLIEKKNSLTKCVYFECFHILSHQNLKFHAKLALCGKKNYINRKVSFECF